MFFWWIENQQRLTIFAIYKYLIDYKHLAFWEAYFVHNFEVFN